MVLIILSVLVVEKIGRVWGSELSKYIALKECFFALKSAILGR